MILYVKESVVEAMKVEHNYRMKIEEDRNTKLIETIEAYEKIVSDQEKQLVDLQVEAYLRANDFKESQKRIEQLEEDLEWAGYDAEEI